MVETQNIEDVLSSIRRLVSEEVADQAGQAALDATARAMPGEALVLAPANRVVEPEDPFQAIPSLAQAERDARDAAAFMPDMAAPGLTDDIPPRSDGMMAGWPQGIAYAAAHARTQPIAEDYAEDADFDNAIPTMEAEELATLMRDVEDEAQAPVPAPETDPEVPEEERFDDDDEAMVLNFIESLPNELDETSQGMDASAPSAEFGEDIGIAYASVFADDDPPIAFGPSDPDADLEDAEVETDFSFDDQGEEEREDRDDDQADRQDGTEDLASLAPGIPPPATGAHAPERDAIAQRETVPEAEAPSEVEAVSEPEILAWDAPDPTQADPEEDEDILGGGIGGGAVTQDTEALRELVAEVVRQELAGALGERITRNVRKLVRRELKTMFAGEEFD